MMRPIFYLLFIAAPLYGQTYDLLLKGGHVIDPANNIGAVRDVAISGGKVARVAPDIPVGEARTVADVSGLYVTPGLIDLHAHVYSHKWVEGLLPYQHPDAACLPSGVTTVVDTGSSGWRNFVDFKEKNIDTSTVRILAFLNIAALGTRGELEQHSWGLDPEITAAVAKKYPDIIVGIKTAHYWTSKPFDEEHPPWMSVDRTIQAGNLCNLPVMIDFWPRPERPYPDLLLKKMRPGDIHTHVFAQQFPIVDKEGKVYDYMFEARRRGIIFDVGHGAGSFWFRIADPAGKGGFWPDSISTDLHISSGLRAAFSMVNVMSKFLNMGMTLDEVIRASTVNPARQIRRSALGTLSVGAEADVAVLMVEKGRFGFVDCGQAKMTGDRNIVNLLTIRAGRVVYDVQGLTMPDWKQAPKSYWFTPRLQGERPPAGER